MPHMSGGSTSSGRSSSDRIRSDDPNDCDEVKVFKCAEDEGENDKCVDDVINDEKSDLIRSTECDQGRKSPSYASSGGSGHSSGYHPMGKNGHATLRSDPTSIFGKSFEGVPHPSPLNMGYHLMPYPYSNGSALSSMKHMQLGVGALPFFCNGVVDGLTQPPPAHMGSMPPYHHLDPKAVHGLSRSPMYPFGGQYPYSVLPEVSQVASWHAGMYSISNPGNSASAGFRNYPPTLTIPPTSIPSDFYSRFSPGSLLQGSGLSHHPSLGHHLVGTSKHDAHSHLDQNHRSSGSSDQKSDSHGNKNSESGQSNNSQNDKKKPHIKKPLNAFMLYMKEMRAKVVAECTLKESAAINQILGRRWHALGREEQAKYYEKARLERARHMQMYPNWSSAQSRTHHEKKRKKKQEKFDGGNSMKKCRARYGLDQQSQWCKPCRRKKKCIRYMEGEHGDGGGLGSPDDNLGSVGSTGEACTPDSKTGMDSDMDCKSSDMGTSSPNFSPGFSLNSPGLSLMSPALTSPCPSGILPSPSSSASPAVSLPSLQSPMTPCLDDRNPISSVSSTASSSINIINSAATNSHNNSQGIFTNNSGNHHMMSSSSSSTSSSRSPPTPSSMLGLPATFNPLSINHHKSNHHHNNNHALAAAQQFGHFFNAGVGFAGLGLGLNLRGPLPHRNPVGANPHDINNPLSVNQLTNNNNHHHHSSSSSNSNSSKRSSSSLTVKSENGNSTPTVIGVS